jgi:hypothetical protein
MAAQPFTVQPVRNDFMKKIFALITLSSLLFSCAEFSPFKLKTTEDRASEDFVQGSEDIPLLVGMEKINDDSLGFDSSSGSIMASSYRTKTDVEKIKNFYIKTLPQMGWKLVENEKTKLSFRRDKEKLEIEIKDQIGKNLVHFFISSAL